MYIFELDFSYWKGILIIILSHFVIDAVKLQLTHNGFGRALFAIDQILHLSILTGVVWIYEPFEMIPKIVFSEKLLLLTAAIICAGYLSSVIIKLLLAGWDINEDRESESLRNAGKYIGILERLFVFGFILLNQWQAVGLLIAAKSVFRFSDLSRSKDRKLTEYILVGTLLSFGLAVFFGLLYKYLTGLIAE